MKNEKKKIQENNIMGKCNKDWGERDKQSDKE